MLKPCEDYVTQEITKVAKMATETINTFSFKPVKINVGYMFS